ncbi:MAG TPA: tetratricopeptide repeat protein, partial [Oscillatoriaceae cyanobacterium]
PWLKALAAGEGEAATRLRPILARVLPELGAPAPALEGMQERVRLHAAIAELASAQAGPLLCVVDDADLLDAASADLLAFLSAQATARGWRFLLAGRTDAEGAIALPPLNDAQIHALAAALLGQSELPEALANSLPVLAGGAPGLAEAILAHWIRTGVLVRAAGRWELLPQADLALPGGLQPALEARFEELSTHARGLARVAALLGSAGELSALSALSGLESPAFFGALAELESAEVLFRDEGSYRFVRPAQATALLAGVEAATRAMWHAQAADWYAAGLSDPDSPDAPLDRLLGAARHGLAGYAPKKAVPWVIAAVGRSLALFATGPCEKLLDAALALPDLEIEDALKLRILRGQWLRIAGRVDEAIALYEENLLAAVRARGLTEHEVTYGILLQLKGRYADALAALAGAINAADEAGDARTGVRAREAAGRVAFFSGESNVAKTHLASAVRRARELGDPARLAGALSLYGYLLASSEADRIEEGLALLDEAITLNEALGDLVEAQEARNNQGNVYMAAGRLGEARKAFEACLELCTRMAAPNEAIFAHLNVGAVLLELGDLAAARDHAKRALEMSRQQGRKFPEGFTLALVGLAELYQGELAVGSGHLASGLALAREIKNRYLELAVLPYWIEALLHLGRFADAREALTAAHDLAKSTHNDEHSAKLARFEALLALGTGAADATERLAALVEAARGAGQAVPLANALTWQAYALRASAEADAPLAEARALAEAHGLRLLNVQLAWLEGVRSGRFEDFEHAVELARELGVPVWEALALGDWGRVDPRARAQRQEAPKRMEALLAGVDADAFVAWPERRELLEHTSVVPEVSSDRLHHLTDLMALISAQPDLDAVMARSLAALVEIAEAERGFLLLYEGFEVVRQVFHGMAEDESDAFSTSLAQQVLWNGEPLYIEDAQSDARLGTQASIQTLALRSVVGVPLFDGQETI